MGEELESNLSMAMSSIYFGFNASQGGGDAGNVCRWWLRGFIRGEGSNPKLLNL